MLVIPFAALALGVVFHLAYLTFIYPTFDYIGFTYTEPTDLALAMTYALIVAPVVGYRPSSAPAAYGAAMVFVLCYIPAQLIFLFRSELDPTFVQLSLAASMTVILRTSGLGWKSELEPGSNWSADTAAAPSILEGRYLWAIVTIVTAVSIVVLLLNYGGLMQVVSLEGIYDQRFYANQIDRGAFSNYFIAALTNCFLPFYYTRAILRKNPLDLAIALAISFLIYAAFAAKTAVLMGVVCFGLNAVFGDGWKFLIRLLVAATAAGVVLYLLPEDQELFDQLRSLVLVRILGIGGYTMSVYYDFFSINPHTFYTHIGPVGALTGAYPYGNLQLGQVIGLNYFATEEANYNANFWASDAFAALGLIGVPVATAGVCLTSYAINRWSEGITTRFVVIWLAGYWQGVLNAPLTTAFVSGGGVVVLMLISLARSLEQRSRANTLGLEIAHSEVGDTRVEHTRESAIRPLPHGD